MTYDPLDDRGHQKLAVGDRVSVSGMMDEDFFGSRQLSADWIVTLGTQDTTAMPDTTAWSQPAS